MKKYEYKQIYEGEAGPTLLEQINKLGEQGWRLVCAEIADGGTPRALLEREYQWKTDI